MTVGRSHRLPSPHAPRGPLRRRHCSGGMSLGSMTFMEFGPFALMKCPVKKADASPPCQGQAGLPDHSTMDPIMTPALQKVALVTGAARGIGLAVAKRFLAEDWRVALLD